jgi:hypothetical protein
MSRGPLPPRRFASPSRPLEFAAGGREALQALSAARAFPDVRADRVADARRRIALGTYTINAEVVAMRILGLRA